MNDKYNESWMREGFKVGAWRVKPQQNRLRRVVEGKGGSFIHLEPKVMQVLVCLAEQPGETVTKQTFRERIWEDTVVTNDALARCISELRKALGDDARDPRYVETIRKTGYRLIVPVTRPAPAKETKPASPAPSLPTVKVEEITDRRGVFWRWMDALAQWLRLLRRYVGSWQRRGAALVLVMLAGAMLWGVFDTGSQPPSSSETIPFTSFPGKESDPAISPDGQQVAFAWNEGKGKKTNIFVKQKDAPKPLQLTDEAAREYSPTWSPDGQRVAFVRSSKKENAIYTVPAIGGEARRVASFDTRRIQGLVWSPDGRTLALAVQRASYEAFSLFLLSVKTQRKRQLTTPPAYYEGDIAPSFSPNGKKLAFVRSATKTRSDLYVVSTRSGRPQRLTADYAEISGVDWTADGKQVIFASDRGGDFRLWQLSAHGGSPTELASVRGGSRNAHQPSTARQGKQMAFTQRSFDANIWRLRWVNGYGNLTERFLFSTRWDAHPDISPSGKRVVFASARSGHPEIWVSSSEGTDLLRLTSFEGPRVSTPRWSPDGKQVVFSVRRKDHTDVYVISAAGGPPHRLTGASFSEVAPSFSRDGQDVYFASNRSGDWQVWQKPVDGGSARQITQQGGFTAREGPDGRYLYYAKRNAPGIWMRSLSDEGPEKRLTRQLQPYDWGSWDVTQRGLYLLGRREGNPVLVRCSFTNGHTSPIATLDRLPRQPSLAAAPNGKWFLFTRADRSESDILLVENFQHEK